MATPFAEGLQVRLHPPLLSTIIIITIFRCSTGSIRNNDRTGTLRNLFVSKRRHNYQQVQVQQFLLDPGSTDISRLIFLGQQPIEFLVHQPSLDLDNLAYISLITINHATTPWKLVDNELSLAHYYSKDDSFDCGYFSINYDASTTNYEAPKKWSSW